MKKILFIAISLIFSNFAVAQSNPNKSIFNLIYDGNVLEIPIAARKETRIIVGFPAKIGYETSIASKGVVTRILPSGIFIKSDKPLDGDYAQIVSVDGKKIIPIRFISNEETENPPTIYKILDQTLKTKNNIIKHDTQKEYRALVSKAIPNKKNKKRNSIVEMVRYAAQSMYASKRHREELSGIKKVSTDKENYRLYPGGFLSTKVIQSYQYGNLFVTTVELKNKLSNSKEIDPRKIIGHWMYAAIQNSNLIKPKGVMFIHLVSDEPFDKSIQKVVNWRKK